MSVTEHDAAGPNRLQCEKCDKIFKKKDLYKKHLARKTSCAKKVSQGHNTATTIADEDDFKTTPSMLSSSMIQTGEKILNVNANTSPTYTRMTLNFGDEDQTMLESMTYDELKKLLKLTPSIDTLFAMVKFININSKIPENQNVMLDEVENTVLLFCRGKWNKLETTKETILNLICRNRLRFYDIEATLCKHMKKKAFSELDEYLDGLESRANGCSKTDVAEEDLHLLINQIKQELTKLSISQSAIT